MTPEEINAILEIVQIIIEAVTLLAPHIQPVLGYLTTRTTAPARDTDEYQEPPEV